MPSDIIGTIAGNRHYSTGIIEGPLLKTAKTGDGGCLPVCRSALRLRVLRTSTTLYRAAVQDTYGQQETDILTQAEVCFWEREGVLHTNFSTTTPVFIIFLSITSSSLTLFLCPIPQSRSVISAVPCQTTTPALNWEPRTIPGCAVHPHQH